MNYVGCVLLVFSPILTAVAQAKPRLQGAWRVIEVATTGPGATVNRSPLPGLMLFTESHYSITREEGSTPRTSVATKDSVAAMINQLRFAAQAGSYALTDDQLELHRDVALGLGHMGNSSTSIIKIAGDTLWITQKSNERGPLPNPTTHKLVRVD
jgi:hypothetical protein